MRPAMPRKARGASCAPRVACTSASRMSTLPPVAWPRCTSIQARTAPWPRASVMSPRSACWRSCATSTRGNMAYNWPLQRSQAPAWTDSKGSRNCPIRVKRSPQSGGGVASRRKLWRQPRLRNTMSTASKASGGAGCRASLQCTVPPRTTTSPWEKSQSAAPPSLAPPGVNGRPAMNNRPSAARRISSAGRSIYSCSNPIRSSERGDSATTTRGNCSAVRPSASSSATSSSSNEGTSTSVRACKAPMRTGTPKARAA